MSLSKQQVVDFQDVVLQYYRQAGRHDLPWRQPEDDDTFSAYKILVSELMLQQTQVRRVIPKFEQFLELFPTVESLATAPLAAVLTAWSGLGYNRRAKYLHQAANYIVDSCNGVFPDTQQALVALPGVGVNTAGAVCAYVYDQPVVFVETNIRTVYFYHFLQNNQEVSDREVAALVQATMPPTHSREWYWALMDYGSYLKNSGIKLNMLSKHYTKQSKFEGSLRQIRGQIIRTLTLEPKTLSELQQLLPDARLATVIADLQREALIVEKAGHYHLSD